MFEHQGVWLPDGEKHFPEWMSRNGEMVDGRGTYQIKKLREAMRHVARFRTAVDVGAHVGLWSMHLAQRFKSVHAFEPMDSFRACFSRNVVESNVLLYACALGAVSGRVTMNYDPADSGNTHVAFEGGTSVTPMMTLDECDIQDVDFIKIDVEGGEDLVIAGGKQTIQKYRPTIIVEQKLHKLKANFGIDGQPALDLLKSLGYLVVRELSGDYVMVRGY